MAYQLGQYRNAKFFTQQLSTTFGRRTAVYELPFDERGVAHIDLGRAPRRYHIEAILLGREGQFSLDYRVHRDALLKALEKPGPGLLVHPEYGRVMVIITGFQISESTAEGAMGTVAFDAIEARDEVPPQAGADGVIDSAKKVREVAGQSFTDRLVTEGPDFLFQDAYDVCDQCLRDLKTISATLTSALEVPGKFARRVDAISIQLTDLLHTERRLYDAFDGLLESLMGSVGRFFDRTTNVEKLAPFGSKRVSNVSQVIQNTFGSQAETIPPRSTPARLQQKENRAGILQSLKASALANSVLALVDNPPTSRTDAQNLSQDLSNQIAQLSSEAVEGNEVPADLYDALKEMGAALQKYMDEVASQAATVRLQRVKAAVPLEILAYRLYGDAKRVQELIDRNSHVAHQGMVPAQTDVEVLDR